MGWARLCDEAMFGPKSKGRKAAGDIPGLQTHPMKERAIATHPTGRTKATGGGLLFRNCHRGKTLAGIFDRDEHKGE